MYIIVIRVRRAHPEKNKEDKKMKKTLTTTTSRGIAAFYRAGTFITKTDIFKKYGSSSAVKSIIDKINARRAAAAPAAHKPEDAEILRRLDRIARAMPQTGHSMGSIQHAYLRCCPALSASCDRTEEYARSCRYSAVHGELSLGLSVHECMAADIIGGIVTIVGSAVRGHHGVRRARWIERRAQKSAATLVWCEGYLGDKYHTSSLDAAQRAADGAAAAAAEAKLAAKKESRLKK